MICVDYTSMIQSKEVKTHILIYRRRKDGIRLIAKGKKRGKRQGKKNF